MATPVPVDLFTRKESVNMLRGRLPQLSEPEADRVAEALEDLPLAVQQAAAFLAETGSTVERYLELLASRAADVLAHGAPVTYRASLAASYQVAFDRLAVNEPAALDLLTLAAHLTPEPIPFTLFTVHAEPLATTAGDPLAFARLTRALRQRALARVTTDSMQLHRLVQAILLSRRARGAGDRIAAVSLRLLRETVPADLWNDPATWPAWRQVLPHVLTLTSRDPEPDDENVAGQVPASPPTPRGHPHPSLSGSGRGSPRHPGLGHNLAVVLHELGEHQQARQLEDYVRAHSKG